MGAWQDRNNSLAGQIWELGRIEKEILAVDNLENTTFSQFFCHFYLFSATFGCFLPHIPVFPPLLLFFSHLFAIFANLQNSLA